MKVFSSTLFLIVLSDIYSCNWKKCKPGEKCVPLQKCPMKQDPNEEDRCALVAERLRICGEYKDGNVKVCCVATSEAHLPRYCGRQPLPHHSMRTNSFPLIGTYPWMVAINLYNGRYTDTGVLISSRFVLTHDLSFFSDGGNISELVYGTSDFKASEECAVVFGEEEGQCFQRMKVGKKKLITKYPLGLIKINRKIDFTDRSALVEPVCLPTPDKTTLNEDIGIVVGQDSRKRITKLRSALFFIEDVENCKEHFNTRKWHTKICARKVTPSSFDFSYGSPLLIWSEAQPPIFTVVGISVRLPANDYYFFESVKEALPWIEKTILL